jgi:hypothetical protein
VNVAERHGQLAIGSILRSGKFVFTDTPGVIICRQDSRPSSQQWMAEVGEHLDVLGVPWRLIRMRHPIQLKHNVAAVVISWPDLRHLRTWLPANADQLAADWKRKRAEMQTRTVSQDHDSPALPPGTRTQVSPVTSPPVKEPKHGPVLLTVRQSPESPHPIQ